MLLNKSLAKYLLEKCCHLKFHLLTFRHLRLNCRFQLLFSQIMTPYNNQVFSCLRVFTKLQLTTHCARVAGAGAGERLKARIKDEVTKMGRGGGQRSARPRAAPLAVCRGNTGRGGSVSSWKQINGSIFSVCQTALCTFDNVSTTHGGRGTAFILSLPKP